MKTPGTTRPSHLILLATFLREDLKAYEFPLLGLGTSLLIPHHGQFDSTWLDRVEAVVDQVLDRGFYAIINVHHDSQLWANLATSVANYTLIEENFKSIWTQIGVKLGCKSSKLVFESINEPAGSTESEAVELNALNDIFLGAINIAGGFNPQRVVSLCGLGNTPALTSQYFSRGSKYPNQPWGLQIHYYSPCKC